MPTDYEPTPEELAALDRYLKRAHAASSFDTTTGKARRDH